MVDTDVGSRGGPEAFLLNFIIIPIVLKIGEVAELDEISNK